MRLGWDEIKRRAKAFSDDWADAHYEKGETQPFYEQFFLIFGVKRKQVATYEQRVKLLNGKHGFMDLFWPKTLLIEQKSARLDLNKAGVQAMDYIDGIRAEDQPRYVLTCDFQTWNLVDLETGRATNFRLADLHKHIESFAFILGRRVSFGTQAMVNIKAAELMGKLHDALEDANYTGHDLEQLLVRLLFCLFADDTGIFEPKDIFLQLIEADTKEDGSDTGRMLIELFDVLNTHEDARQKGLSGELNAFPYVNGALFAGHIRTPVFDKKMREMLLDAARFDWGKVSPAIFGSLFQSVMDAKERRAKGAHYTTEANILKVIGPLFLDDLRAEFDKIKTRKTGRAAALQEFQNKLSRLTFMDPACGCGNFLVIAYRELRNLELCVLHELWDGQRVMDISAFSRVNVDQFYGIEFEEFPARIAEVAMWMTDHIANNELSLAFGQSFARIPLKQSAKIIHGDALEVNWAALLPPEKCHYIMGNPPFIGAKFQSPFQRAQVRRIAGLGGSGGTLDYVAAWFIKAGQYMANTPSPLAGEGARLSEAQPSLVAAGEGASAGAENNAPQTRRPPSPDPSGHPWSLSDQSGGLVPPRPQGEREFNKRIRIAFVSTNSITQGEQVAQLWPILFDRLHLEIFFAHRTFSWGSEARGKAHVHVVIIGLTHRDNEPDDKRLFSYPDIKGDPVESQHAALTAYLFDAQGVANRHLTVASTSSPINGANRMGTGSQPIDYGQFVLDRPSRDALLASEPAAAPFVYPYVAGDDFINGGLRWVLNLKDIDPSTLRSMPLTLARVKIVKEQRLKSLRKSTLAAARHPNEFGMTVIPEKPYLVFPKVSSERRDYVPIGWVEPPTIPSDLVYLLVDATLWEFAIITSRSLMAWLAQIGGRLESRFRFSSGLVYNTFPWPEATPAQRAKIEALAQAVLDARAAHPTSSLADLYDPDTMPGNLRKAHAALDLAVDRLYRPAPFASDRDRVEHLFGRYEALVNPLEREAAKQNKRINRKAVKPTPP
ncbi:DNA methyltransferase [Sphingorhabdus sp.]|uniref:DNA methyltransferase n=1 Tax=Sphingorhabdus sp. TaxID=1902408 RepID=UPI003D81A7B1